MDKFKNIKPAKETEDDPDKIFLDEYDLEIAGFIEHEMPVLFSEMNADEDRHNSLLEMFACASEHGLHAESISRLKADYQSLIFDWNDHYFRLLPVNGRTPYEIAWMIYQLSDEDREGPLNLGRAWIAFRDNLLFHEAQRAKEGE